jgi:pilus assembly protein CpaE
MDNKSILVRLIIKNDNLKHTLENILASTADFHALASGSNSPADLIIYELGHQVAKEFQQISFLLNKGGAGEVFIVSENTDQSILLQAIKTGVKEFFSLPLNEKEVLTALQKFQERRRRAAAPTALKLGRVINVIGSKGGVGTTTIAVNLAVSLAARKNKLSVALVDMNMLFGDIPLFLEIKPKYHWGEITKNIDRLDATFLMNVLARHSSGVHVLPSPGYLNGYPSPTPEIIEQLLMQMQQLFDVVIVDGGQSLDQTSLRTIEISNDVLLVSALSLPYLSNSNKILKSFRSLDLLPDDRIHLVINRYLKKSDISLQDAEASMRKKIFWALPNDYKTTMSAINQGKAVCEVASKNQLAHSFQGLAGLLVPEENKNRKKGWKIFGG